MVDLPEIFDCIKVTNVERMKKTHYVFLLGAIRPSFNAVDFCEYLDSVTFNR
jgi:hypothetical protein